MEGTAGDARQISRRVVQRRRGPGRGVKMTGSAHAGRGVVCWFQWVDVPNPEHGEKWWRRDAAGDVHAHRPLHAWEAARAERRPQ